MRGAFESSSWLVHRAFGLRIQSRLHWLPLRPVDDPGPRPDVIVEFGRVPAGLGELASRTARFEALPGRLLFKTRTIANYLVEGGRRILIEPKPGAGRWELGNLLLGAVTGGVLIQRGTLALHGCSLETPDGAVIVCGPSGAGKSTLAMLLLDRGFRILDDNIAPIVFGGCPEVLPGSGFLRLTRETLSMIRKTSPGPSFQAPLVHKHIHLLRPEEHCATPRTVRHIFLLDRTREALLSALPAGDKLALIQRHTFMGGMVQGLGKRIEQFRQGLDLANAVPISRLGHPPHLRSDRWADAVAGLLHRSQIRV